MDKENQKVEDYNFSESMIEIEDCVKDPIELVEPLKTIIEILLQFDQNHFAVLWFSTNFAMMLDQFYR